MPAQNNSRIAGGTINPFSFLQPNPGVELGALQCSGPGVEIIGIAGVYTNRMQGQDGAPAQGYPAATVNQPILVYGDGEETILMVGSGYTIEPDNLLVSDASGNGIPLDPTTTTPVQWVGARAIEGGVSGDPIRVTVVLRNYVSN